jgi:UDP-glucuronate decarboxylase
MKILVTGAKGLIGAELCLQLSAQGHQVIALDNGFRGQAQPWASEFLEFDLATGDFSLLPTDLDMIYHFGAINGTRYFYEIPNQLLKNNLNADLNVFNWAQSLKNLQNIVYASSSEVVSGYIGDEIDETTDIMIHDIHNARWSYRLAKVCAENYLSNSDLPFTIVRYFNVYGANSFSGHFVYDIVQKIKKNCFELTGPGETRCYCHVEDAVDATIRISHYVGKLINIGSDQEIDSLSAANIIADIMGYHDIQWKLLPSRPGSAARRKPDISLLRSLYPEFSPRDFPQGIKDVIDFL